jgi:O-antigen/teichoic acid export membrane protein
MSGRHYYYLGLGVAAGFLCGAFAGLFLCPKGTFKWAPGSIPQRAKELLKYGVFATLSGLSAIVLYNLDKVLVGYYLHPEDVGTYFAYSLSSMGGIGILALGVTFALFPRISEKSRGQKRQAFYALNRLVVRLLPVALVMVFIGQVLFLAIIGKYELRLDRLILFSLYGTMTALAAIYSWFASSDKGWGIRGVGITTALAAALFLGSSILWLHDYGVDGFVFSVMTSFGLANIGYVLLSYRIVK